ncbi:class I SAM-dependent methyltransferase [Streptomyces sporangiiformans]|uniref:Class I SAM-dependent methyltransferase n=1 Tax=Streptomyces sporangiiformans TaxID=2315329 RepID=A0A505D0N5_9ACTN|nr:class I SAM-dependent methyltransferase [Streptomyces sporangiiformans]TPQ16297.1 class I SAM-dependent methyltransferase [Streptomyces sporangiiformans]
MFDYNKEAEWYDASRGGEPRAAAAASAVLGMLPEGTRTLLDVACGTGTVTRCLAAAGLDVTGADAAYGMLSRAAEQVPGRVVRADSRQLPFPDSSFDAVSAIWLLHLLDDAALVVAEAARVLRPGGVFVTTVDKAASHDVGSDIDAVMAPRPRRAPRDEAALVTGFAADSGLLPEGRSAFPGRGQGRTPARAAADVRRGWYTLLRPKDALTEELASRLEELPDQHVPRPEPEFKLRSFRKPGPRVG